MEDLQVPGRLLEEIGANIWRSPEDEDKLYWVGDYSGRDTDIPTMAPVRRREVDASSDHLAGSRFDETLGPLRPTSIYPHMEGPILALFGPNFCSIDHSHKGLRDIGVLAKELASYKEEKQHGTDIPAKRLEDWELERLHPGLTLHTTTGIDTWSEMLDTAASFAKDCDQYRTGAGPTVSRDVRVIIANGPEIFIQSDPNVLLDLDVFQRRTRALIDCLSVFTNVTVIAPYGPDYLQTFMEASKAHYTLLWDAWCNA